MLLIGFLSVPLITHALMPTWLSLTLATTILVGLGYVMFLNLDDWLGPYHGLASPDHRQGRLSPSLEPNVASFARWYAGRMLNGA